jgi:hypothetical protein
VRERERVSERERQRERESKRESERERRDLVQALEGGEDMRHQIPSQLLV